MKLRLSWAPYRVALPRTVANSQRSWQERRGFLITLSDEHGLEGQGEAAPLPGYSNDGDDLDGAEKSLRNCRTSELEVAELEPSLLGACLNKALPRATPSARFGVETALLDLLARQLGLPLHCALRVLANERDLHAPRTIALAALLAFDSDPAEAAERAVGRGFSCLKVKIGGADFPAELAALAAIRRRVGPKIRLRLDANQAFSPSIAGERLAALAAFSPEFVEEPLARGAPWPERPPVPLALDESLRDRVGLGPELSASHGVVAAVLKPGVLGGLLAAHALAELARRAGLAPVVSHAFEGPVGFAAACELALALGVESFAAGLAPHAALEGWSSPLPAAVSNARLVGHERSGLGLPVLAVPA